MSDSEEIEDPAVAEARQAKQAYLKTEVLDKGYDAELFSDYVTAQRGDDLNIDDFSLEELQSMVTQFQTLPDESTRAESEIDEGLQQIEEEDKDGSSDSDKEEQNKEQDTAAALPTIEEELP